MIDAAMIEMVVTVAQGVIRAYIERQYPSGHVPVPTLKVSAGAKKFARLYKDCPSGSRSAYGFICLESGNLYKADGWKRPALNFPRGNVLTGDLACCGPYSIG